MVSVIVPVYRAERWLPACVESILDQSVKDLELLLIDDGSPDGCGILCDEYARRDARVRVVHQRNRGPAAARNAGLDMARGDYITFCDADDFWEPAHLQGLLEAAEKTGAQMVSCNYQVVDEAGNYRRSSRHVEGVWVLETEEDRLRYIINNVLGWKTGWEVWSRLFTAGVIREGNIRFCETCGSCGEDLIFVLSVCLYAKTLCGLGAATYHYRIHPTSLTGSSHPAQNINALNEGARYLEPRYRSAIGKAHQQLFPILHYGILRGEYEKLPAAEFPAAIGDLTEEAWFLQQVRGLLRQKTALKSCYGKQKARRILVRARFCIHRKPLRFRLEKCLLTGDLFRKICGILWSET